MRQLSLLVLWVLSVVSTSTLAESPLQPYILASQSTAPMAEVVTKTRAALKGAGYQVVGEYAPYEGVQLLVVTDANLQQNAAASEFGGYGAAIRVALSKTEAGVQVSYNNPRWMAQAYRMQGDLVDQANKLAQALGAEQAFGSEEGIKSSDLREYHYMMMMPYFDDQLELAEFSTHAEALAMVELGLSDGLGGTKQVYRIAVPGKEEVVFGVALAEGDGADKTVMANCDQAKLKHSAHLPYELLVSGKGVYALHGKFRIAQSFPDLTMGTFMQISGAPGAIEEAFEKVVGKD